jgi:oxygen-independent coproporphyrinogen III oxidase
MTIPVSPELLAKHDKAGPRYTSYPTVPVWSRDFGQNDYLAALGDLADRPDDELSIYLHLPFCAKHCHYCGCNAIESREKGAVDTYLDRVERELDTVIDVIGRGRRTVQIHWGGGTPNFLKPPQVERTLGLLRDRFDVAPDAEISLEIDPRIGSPEEAAHLQSVGFNRISLGIQDFEPDVQKAIGRKQSRERTLKVYHGCRDAGFAGVNVDLVYGLPGQTRDSFSDTLREIIALEPDRVACFSYAHVPWVRPDQEKVDTTHMPSGYEKFELFQLSIDMFADAGYDWIGIDHFAKRDDELAVARRERRLHRNFMGYTTKPAPHMLAFGMSGIGDVCDRFIQNDATLDGWNESLDAGRLPIVRGHVLTADDRLRRLSILHLMCNNELPWDLTVPGFGAPANELLASSLAAMKPYEDEGFVEFADDRLVITDLGRHFARNVCMELDAHLDRDSKQPLFSRTV